MSATSECDGTAPGSVVASGNESAADAAVPQLADCSRAEQAEKHYLAIINDLGREARKNETMEAFTDVLCWTLARVIVHYDKPQITGDILKRVGNYTAYLGEIERAEQEAGKSKEEGHVPH